MPPSFTLLSCPGSSHLSQLIPSLLFLLLPFLFSLLVFLRHRTKKSTDQDQQLPPGPDKLPVIGNLHQLLGRPLHIALQHLARKHGPLMFLKLGFAPTIVVSSAEIAKEIFKNHDLAFSSRPALYAGKRLSYGCLDMAFSPYGEYWRQVRRISVIELLSSKRVESFRGVREEEVGLLIAAIRKEASSSPDSLGTVDLSEKMLVLANNVVCRTVFGSRYVEHSGKSRLHEILHETQALLADFNVADFFPNMEWLNTIIGVRRRLEENFRTLDSFYELAMKEHLHKFDRRSQNKEAAEPENEDLVSVLLRLQRDPNQETAMTSDHIKGILTDMFVAGTDTSSALLVWTMAELMRNPQIMKKAQEEVRRAMGEKEKVEESDLQTLHYLKMIVKEALRLHPPAPLLVPRETIEKCSVGGYEIPAKTRVLVNARAIQMDPKHWKNPEEFQPERFFNNPIDFRGQHYELLPFGTGRRRCPGIYFSIVTVELALANLLHCFDWDLPHGMTREDVDMEEALGITVHKKAPLLLVASLKS